MCRGPQETDDLSPGLSSAQSGTWRVIPSSHLTPRLTQATCEVSARVVHTHPTAPRWLGGGDVARCCLLLSPLQETRLTLKFCAGLESEKCSDPFTCSRCHDNALKWQISRQSTPITPETESKQDFRDLVLKMSWTGQKLYGDRTLDLWPLVRSTEGSKIAEA